MITQNMHARLERSEERPVDRAIVRQDEMKHPVEGWQELAKHYEKQLEQERDNRIRDAAEIAGLRERLRVANEYIERFYKREKE